MEVPELPQPHTTGRPSGDLDSGSSSLIYMLWDVVSRGSVPFCVSVASPMESGLATQPTHLAGQLAISHGHSTALPVSADTLSGAWPWTVTLPETPFSLKSSGDINAGLTGLPGGLREAVGVQVLGTCCLADITI